MKVKFKSALLTSMLAAAGVSAHAEGFNFYALVDGGMAATSISGAGTTASKTEFVTGGYAPTFLGITSEKSMGGGYSAGFKVEQGFLLNAPPKGTNGDSRFFFGADNNLFNRQANVYLKSGYGTLIVGTTSNIAFDSVVMVEPRAGSNFGSALATISLDGSLGTVDSGAVSYASPSFSGFTVAATYVPETKTATTPATTTGSRLAATYANGPLKATLATYVDDVSTNTNRKNSGNIAGATYQIGPWGVKALYTRQSTNTLDGLATIGFGGNYALNDKTTIDAGVYRSTESGTDYKMETMAAGVQYQFVKGLTAYAQYASVKNNGTANGSFNFAGPSVLNFTSLTSGQTASTFNVGLLYAFF